MSSAFSFTDSFPNHPHLHPLQQSISSSPPRSATQVEQIKDDLTNLARVIFTDGLADDVQTYLSMYGAQDSRTERDIGQRAGPPRPGYVIVAGQQGGGWDTYAALSSLVERVEALHGNEVTDRGTDCISGEGFVVVRGGPRDTPRTEQDEEASQAAADRVSGFIPHSPYVAHLWTSANTFSRFPPTAQRACEGLVLTCGLTLETDKHSTGWNRGADEESYRAAEEVMRENGKSVVHARLAYMNVPADHQMAFDKPSSHEIGEGEGGFESLLDTSVGIHPHDQATFDRTRFTKMGKNLLQLSIAEAFLNGQTTASVPTFPPESPLAALVDPGKYANTKSIKPTSVFLSRLINANNPYLDMMGDPAALGLTDPEVELVPVEITSHGYDNVDIGPVDSDTPQVVNYLAVAPKTYEEKRVSLVDETAAREWLRYVPVASALAQSCFESLGKYGGDGLSSAQKEEAAREYGRIIKDLADGTMTEVSKSIVESK